MNEVGNDGSYLSFSKFYVWLSLLIRLNMHCLNKNCSKHLIFLAGGERITEEMTI